MYQFVALVDLLGGSGGIDLVAPVLAGLALGSLGISAASNLYSQRNSRRLYRAYEKDYTRWYNDYRKNTGRTARYPMLSAYGNAYAQKINRLNSVAGSIGTTAGTLGVEGTMLKRYLGE